MPRIPFDTIFALSYLGGYFSICFGYIITGIASKIITFASPIALNAFVAAGISASLGVGVGIFALGIGIGLAYNKLSDSISSLRDELLRNPPNIARCRGLSKTINIFKYLTFGLASKTIDRAITGVAFQVHDNNRSYEIMQFLVNEGIKPNNIDLLEAVHLNNGRLVRLLLQNGCNPNYGDMLRYALHAVPPPIESIAALIERGVKIKVHHLARTEHLQAIAQSIPLINKDDQNITPEIPKIWNALLARQQELISNPAYPVGSQGYNTIMGYLDQIDPALKILKELYIKETEKHLNQNEKAKVNLEVLRSIFLHQSNSLEEKTQIQNLLNQIHGRWAAEIGPVLAKGEAPVYQDQVNSQILGHRKDLAMQQVFREPGAMSSISEFLTNQDLGRAKQSAKPEEKWILPASGPNQMPLEGAGGGGQSVAPSSPQSVAIDIPSKTSAQSGGEDDELRPASPARSHAERHRPQERSPKRSRGLKDIISNPKEVAGSIESNQQPDLEGAGGNLDEGGNRRGRG